MFITVDLFNFVDIRIEIYSLTFEFVVLEVTHCLLLFIICNPCRTKFRGFMIPTKTTKIGIQWERKRIHSRHNVLNYLAFKYFGFECIWWRLFQNRLVRNKFIYVFIMHDYDNLLCATWEKLDSNLWNGEIINHNTKTSLQ